jgi:hypothetical protein
MYRLAVSYEERGAIDIGEVGNIVIGHQSRR